MNEPSYNEISALIKALIEISGSCQENHLKLLILEICNRYNIFPEVEDITNTDVESIFKQLSKKQKAEFGYYILKLVGHKLKKEDDISDMRNLIRSYIDILSKN